MKKIIITAVAIFCVPVIIFFIPVNEKNVVSIAAPIIAVSQQMNTAANWRRWYPDFKMAAEKDSGRCKVHQDYQLHCFTISIPQQTIKVKNPWAGRFEINMQKESKACLFNVTLVAGKDVASSAVIIERKVSLFYRLFSSAKNNSTSDNIIKYLKTFVETDSLYYGFNISIQPVIDTNVVSYSKHVPNSEKFIMLPSMYKTLENFVHTNKLMILQPPMLMYSQLAKDSMIIIAMLGVNKFPPKDKSIQTIKMPVNGRMLVGILRGKYKHRIQLEIAMQQYCQDKNLQSIIGSYEKFTNNLLPQNEESIVEMEIHFPIL